jgi:hypothetical protein
VRYMKELMISGPTTPLRKIFSLMKMNTDSGLKHKA